MPFSVEVDSTYGILRISISGSVGDADLLDLSRTARSQPALRDGAGVLYDCSGVTDLGVSSSLIRDLGARAREDRNRVAFVASTPVAIGLARMYQIVSGGEQRMQIFRDEKDALAWLLHGLGEFDNL